MSRPCTNCAAPLPEPLPNFCPACGQETRLRAPTLGEFVQQFGGAFLSTEGALWRTLKLLLARPGELTRQYLAGRRKHYVLPLRLYLTISVVVLLVMRVLTQIGLDEPVAVKVDAGDLSSIVVDLGTSRAGMKDGRFFCENMPGWLCKRIQRRIDVAPQAFAREALAIGERFVANLGAAMFVLLPAFAALMKLAYLDRGLRYTEHLVFALHLHAFWFLAIALTLANTGWLTVLAVLAVPAYGLAAMKRVYAGRWWPLLLRAAFVSLVYLFVLLLALAGVALWSLLF
jgi:hypothetical protein